MSEATNKQYLKPVSTDKLVRCGACGEMFLKTDIEGQHVRCFGMCRRCYEYFDGLYKYIEAIENSFNIKDAGNEKD